MQIKNISEELHEKCTFFQKKQLEQASPEQILKLAKANQLVRLEIAFLKKYIESYIEQIDPGPDWFDNLISPFGTKLYLKLAREFKTELDGIMNVADELATVTQLSMARKSIISRAQDGHYFFFNKSLARDFKNISEFSLIAPIMSI